MPCTPMTFKMKEGPEVHAIVCSRGKRHWFPCVVCGKPHTFLCDGKPGTWPNIKSQSGTCSAPLCKWHTHHVAPNLDYCPRCRPTSAVQGEANPSGSALNGGQHV